MMASAPALSVIVPVYNLAGYLRPCLDSLLHEDADATEIILVDDGSTDASPEVLSEYAARYGVFRVVRQANGGLSVARNVGIDAARGEFVAFCDADDFVAPGYYTRLRRLAQARDLDMALGNAVYHFEGRHPDHTLHRDGLPQDTLPGSEWLRYHLRRKSLLHMACMQVYRRSFIDAHDLRFIPGMIHEDVIWTTRCLLLAGRIAYAPEAGYFYRQHKRNVRRPDAALLRIIDSSLVNAHTLDELAAGLGDDPELQRLLRWQLVDGGLSIFHKVAKLSDRSLRRRTWERFKAEQVFGLLWRNAVEFRQRRRVARNYLKALVALAAK